MGSSGGIPWGHLFHLEDGRKMVGWATQAGKRCAEIEDSMDKMGFNLKKMVME